MDMQQKQKELLTRKESLKKTITNLLSEKISELLTSGSYNNQPLNVNLTDWSDDYSSEFVEGYGIPHNLKIQLVNNRKGYADSNPLSEGKAYFSYEESYFKANLEFIIAPYTTLYEEMSSHRDCIISIEKDLEEVNEELRKEKEKAEKEQLIQQKLKEIETLKAELDKM